MTETLVGVSPPKEFRKAVSPDEQELAAARELVKAARARGVALTGPDGLLKAITKTVLESALEEEMSEHVGYDKHAVQGRNGGNFRNGTRSKTVLTEAAGEVSVEVPRDRAGTFEPVVVKKRQRRLSDVDAVAISLYAKGLTTGEISAHFAEVYGASVSKDTVSRITDRVVEDMQAWCARPLQAIYAAVFIDAIYVKVRDGQVGNQPFYAAIGVDLDGHRDVLGLWAGHGGGRVGEVLDERADRPAEPGCAGRVLHRLRRPQRAPGQREHGVPLAIVQACVIHLDPGHPAVRLSQVLGPAGPRPEGDLHRPDRAGGVGGVRGAGGEVGQAVPGDPQTVAGRVGGVHALPRVRRGDTPGPVLHQCD